MRSPAVSSTETADNGGADQDGAAALPVRESALFHVFPGQLAYLPTRALGHTRYQCSVGCYRYWRRALLDVRSMGYSVLTCSVGCYERSGTDLRCIGSRKRGLRREGRSGSAVRVTGQFTTAAVPYYRGADCILSAGYAATSVSPPPYLDLPATEPKRWYRQVPPYAPPIPFRVPAQRTALPSYARSMPCPYYAMSGTAMTCGAARCCAMCGTELAYSATRRPVLSERMTLCGVWY
eukprot:3116012-Rhodomonas_salina.4